MKEVNTVATYIACTIYTYIIVIKRGTILKLITQMDNEEYHTNEEYKPVKIYIEVLSKFYLYSIQCFLLIWFIVRVAWTGRCLSRKAEEGNSTIVCANILCAWLPKQMDSPVIDWCIVAFSIYCLYYMAHVVTVSCIHIGSTYIAVARIQRLIRILGDIDFVAKDIRLTRHRLTQSIEFYNETHELVQLINDYVKVKLNPLLCYFMMFVIAILCHKIIEDFDLLLLAAMMVWFISNIFIALRGQDLENMCEALNNFIYGLPWYEMHPSLIKDFQLFFARTQKPFEISVPMNLKINMTYIHKFIKFAYTTFMYLTRIQKE
ncbi:uncharacterized protein LOC123673548 [Harmonia axyridis]|uniref:uncharacterized protein LOC123673548 n=1 Tax=Harmonia axyridis TaxID=115357 RepID=UPI001E278248|nr:uncharacterized protein LOC123673548 [Harmonia axyridis]